jgi:hypothetical protein
MINWWKRWRLKKAAYSHHRREHHKRKWMGNSRWIDVPIHIPGCPWCEEPIERYNEWKTWSEKNDADERLAWERYMALTVGTPIDSQIDRQEPPPPLRSP